MSIPNPRIKGYWIQAQHLYDYIHGLYMEAVKKHDKIALIGDPEKMRLKGMISALNLILKFMSTKVLYGGLRPREPKK